MKKSGWRALMADPVSCIRVRTAGKDFAPSYPNSANNASTVTTR